jgi:hypothetical protein
MPLAVDLFLAKQETEPSRNLCMAARADAFTDRKVIATRLILTSLNDHESPHGLNYLQPATPAGLRFAATIGTFLPDSPLNRPFRAVPPFPRCVDLVQSALSAITQSIPGTHSYRGIYSKTFLAVRCNGLAIDGFWYRGLSSFKCLQPILRRIQVGVARNFGLGYGALSMNFFVRTTISINQG